MRWVPEPIERAPEPPLPPSTQSEPASSITDEKERVLIAQALPAGHWVFEDVEELPGLRNKDSRFPIVFGKPDRALLEALNKLGEHSLALGDHLKSGHL
jgi:hypothetical protein